MRSLLILSALVGGGLFTATTNESLLFAQDPVQHQGPSAEDLTAELTREIEQAREEYMHGEEGREWERIREEGTREGQKEPWWEEFGDETTEEIREIWAKNTGSSGGISAKTAIKLIKIIVTRRPR